MAHHRPLAKWWRCMSSNMNSNTRMENLSEYSATQEKWTVGGPTILALGDMPSSTSIFVMSDSSKRGWRSGDFEFEMAWGCRKAMRYSTNLNSRWGCMERVDSDLTFDSWPLTLDLDFVECVAFYRWGSRCIITPPLDWHFHLIFKGKSLMMSWIPRMAPRDWHYAYNMKGWTNNEHGIKWIKLFDAATVHKTNGKKRLLLCDGHDSHISTELVRNSIDDDILILLVNPHSSHLMQPLDIVVFGPLKRAMWA